MSFWVKKAKLPEDKRVETLSSVRESRGLMVTTIEAYIGYSFQVEVKIGVKSREKREATLGG